MIKYQLKCECGKEFESWFSSSKEFDKLEKKKMLSCICGTSNKITKQLMSPQVAIGSKVVSDKQKEIFKNVQKKLADLRNYVEKMQNLLAISSLQKLDLFIMIKKM